MDLPDTVCTHGGKQNLMVDTYVHLLKEKGLICSPLYYRGGTLHSKGCIMTCHMLSAFTFFTGLSRKETTGLRGTGNEFSSYCP